MVSISKNNQIMSLVLSMDDAQLGTFLASLSPDTLSYLGILLEKAERTAPSLKKYLDTIHRLRT